MSETTKTDDKAGDQNAGRNWSRPGVAVGIGSAAIVAALALRLDGQEEAQR